MSCFSGTLKEYPSILVDRFTKKAQAYFLSHCHKDHMDGLDSPSLTARLQSSPHLFIYCSETSRNLLLCNESYTHLKEYLRAIPVDQPELVVLHNESTNLQENLLVTLLPAGHCVGSVMFLFEGDKGNVLYTGDFRLAKGDAKRITHLHSNGRVKDIRSVYVDTTFCLPKMMSIPSREETRDAIIGLIDKWFSRGGDRIVSLLCKGMYGYEYLLKEVAVHFKTKIHVSEERLAMYRYLVAMTPHFTTDPKETRIHACVWKEDKSCPTDLPCLVSRGSSQKPRVLRIKPSTLWFSRHKEPLPGSCTRYSEEERLWRVVHSMHASMEEIRDLIGYIRPYHVYPCVAPAGLHSLDDAADSLKDLIRIEECDSCNKEKFGDAVLMEAATAQFQKTEEIGGRVKRPAPSAKVIALCKELGLDGDPSFNAPPMKRKRNKKRDNYENAADPAREEDKRSALAAYCGAQTSASNDKDPGTRDEVGLEPRARGGLSEPQERTPGSVCEGFDTDQCPEAHISSDLDCRSSNQITDSKSDNRPNSDVELDTDQCLEARFSSDSDCSTSDQITDSKSDSRPNRDVELSGAPGPPYLTDDNKVDGSSEEATDDGPNSTSRGQLSKSLSCKGLEEKEGLARIRSVEISVHKKGDNLLLLEGAFADVETAEFAAERCTNYNEKDSISDVVRLGDVERSDSKRFGGQGNDFNVPPSPGHTQPSPDALHTLHRRLRSGSQFCNKSLGL